MMQDKTLYQVLDGITEMVLVVEIATRVVRYANRVAGCVTGIHAGDVLAAQFLPLWDAPPTETFTNYLDSLTLPDGTPIPVVMTRSPAAHESVPSLIYTLRDLRAPDGDILPNRLLADEMAALLKTRHELMQGRHLNKVILAALPQSVFMVNRDQMVQNPRASDGLHLSLLPPDHAGSASLVEILPPQMGQRGGELVQRAFASGHVALDLLDLGADGAPLSYALHAVPAQDDLVLLIVRDATPERRSVLALQESEKRYRGLIESQQDLIVRVDNEGRFTFVNDAYCEKFGKTRQELIGRTFMPLVHEADRASTLDSMKALDVPPYRAYVEQRAMTAEGWRWLAWEDYAIRDEKGQTVEIQAVGRDITALKESQSTLAYQSRLFQSVSTATRRLLTGDPQHAFDDILRMLGEVVEADFIHLYENQIDDQTGEPVAVVRSQWRSASMLDAPGLLIPEVLPWTIDGQPVAFYDHLKSGEGLQRLKEEFGEAESALVGELGIRSGLAEPIMIGDDFWGGVAVYAHFQPRVWADAEAQALRTLAANLATGISRMRVENDLLQERAYAETLREAGMILTATLEPEEVLRKVLEQARRVVPFDAACILMVEDNVACVAHAIGYDQFGITMNEMRSRSFDLHKTELLHEIVETQNSLVIGTVTRPSEWPHKGNAPEVKSWMGTPIMIGGQVAGFFVVESIEAGFYNNRYRRMVEPFVYHAALALQNAQLYAQVVRQTFELTRSIDRMKSISEASRIILSSLSLTESLDLLLDSIGRVITFDTANVMQLVGDRFRFLARRGYRERGVSDDDLSQIEVALSDMPGLHEIVTSGRPHVIPDVDQDDQWVRVSGVSWIRSWMGAPIAVRGKVVGIFSLDSSQAGQYTFDDVEMMDVFAQLASVAYQNAQLHEAVEKQLGQIIALYSASQSIVSILDLDTILNELAVHITSLAGATSTLICDYDPDDQSGVIQAAFASDQVPVLEAMRERGDRVMLKSKHVQQIILGSSGVQLSGSRLKEVFPDSDLMDHVQRAYLTPLASRGRTTGFALVRDSQPENKRDEDLLLMVGGLANQAANALQQAYYVDEIERLEALKSDMLRIASHDLRTPLQRIKSSIEMLALMMPQLAVERHHNYFDFALSGVAEVDTIIHEILSLDA